MGSTSTGRTLDVHVPRFGEPGFGDHGLNESAVYTGNVGVWVLFSQTTSWGASVSGRLVAETDG